MITELAVAAAAPEGCAPWDLLCIGAQVVDTIANKVLAEQAAAWLNGWMQLEMWFFASWIAIPLLVDITSKTGLSYWLSEVLSSITFFFAVLGSLITAGYTFLKLGWERVRTLGWRLGVLMVITIAGAPAIALLDRLSRNASIWLLSQVGIDGTTPLVTSVAITFAPTIPIILGIIATIGLIIQWGIMIARGPLVAVLVGIWPTAAAAATIHGAEGSFNKISRWLIAFVVYPFPAAIIYAAAFKMKSGSDGIGGIMYGFVLEMLALFLLPAILRIIAPVTTALGKAYGGEIAVKAAATVAETAVAVGAAVVTAGAAAGFLGAKAATAGAKAASSAASGAANAGAGANAGGAAGNATAGSGAGGAPSTPGRGSAAEPAGGRNNGGAAAGGRRPEAGGGAAPVSPGTPDTAPGARTPGTSPTGGTDTAPTPERTRSAGNTPPTPAQQPAQPAPRGASSPTRRAQAGAQAGAQAAQAASNRIGHSTREALNDMDEIIGGKDG